MKLENKDNNRELGAEICSRLQKRTHVRNNKNVHLNVRYVSNNRSHTPVKKATCQKKFQFKTNMMETKPNTAVHYFT